MKVEYRFENLALTCSLLINSVVSLAVGEDSAVWKWPARKTQS